MTAPDHPIPFAEPVSDDVLGRFKLFMINMTICGPAYFNGATLYRHDLKDLLARLDYLEDAYKWFSESGQARKDRAAPPDNPESEDGPR